MEFLNKVCLVTGAARGIGRCIAEAFFNEGADVCIWDIDMKQAKEVKNNLYIKRKTDNEVFLDEVDLAKPKQIIASMNLIQKKFKKVDILVNNAGIYSILDIDHEDEDTWERTIKINLTGCFLTIKAVLPIMIRNRYGKIINISSISGKKESLFASPSYCASKSGIIGLTRCIAAKVARYGINVNCVAPAITKTDGISFLNTQKIKEAVNTIPLGRMGKPEDIANAVLFLSKEGSDYITGETINVNGGSFME